MPSKVLDVEERLVGFRRVRLRRVNAVIRRQLSMKEIVWPYSFERLAKAAEHHNQISLSSFVWKFGYADEKLPISTGWSLPGRGSPREFCGSIRAKGCLNSDDHPEYKTFVTYYMVSCVQRSCPICFEGWASREAERVVARLSTFVMGSKDVKRIVFNVRREMKGKTAKEFHIELVSRLETALKKVAHMLGGYRRPIHVVLSPPQDVDFGYSNYRALRKKAYEVAQKTGLIGGVVFFHPYRLKCDSCEAVIPDYKRKCPSCKKERFVWVKGPHFHVVGFGYIHDTKKNYDQTGWVVKNLGVRESVFWTCQYLLSHTGVWSGKYGFHGATWFGKLAYRNFKTVKIWAFRVVCPYCFHALVPLMFVGKATDKPPPSYDRADPEKNCFLDSRKNWVRIG